MFEKSGLRPRLRVLPTLLASLAILFRCSAQSLVQGANSAAPRLNTQGSKSVFPSGASTLSNSVTETQSTQSNSSPTVQSDSTLASSNLWSQSQQTVTTTAQAESRKLQDGPGFSVWNQQEQTVDTPGQNGAVSFSGTPGSSSFWGEPVAGSSVSSSETSGGAISSGSSGNADSGSSSFWGQHTIGTGALSSGASGISISSGSSGNEDSGSSSFWGQHAIGTGALSSGASGSSISMESSSESPSYWGSSSSAGSASSISFGQHSSSEVSNSGFGGQTAPLLPNPPAPSSFFGGQSSIDVNLPSNQPIPLLLPDQQLEQGGFQRSLPTVGSPSTVVIGPSDPYLPTQPLPNMIVTFALDDSVALASCSGSEEQWSLCKMRPCNDLKDTAINCVFGEWGDWSPLGGCSGLGVRTRHIATRNNAAGMPCSGPKEETRQIDSFYGASCEFGNRDCEWDTWSDWSHCGDCNACGEDRQAQSERYRKPLNQALGDGVACSGDFNQTRSCGSEKPINCKLSVWAEWTLCSASCGGGVQSRMRRVITEAQFGGVPCYGDLRLTQECQLQPCEENVDCVMTGWGPWHGCSVTGSSQERRERQVVRYAKGNGKLCDASLVETQGCNAGVDWCVLTEWSSWTACGVACGGGQQERVRRMPNNRLCVPLGSADLREVRGCNLDECDSLSRCHMSDWSDWADCSQRCGQGVTTRDRSIVQAASNGGSTCTASLKEMRECTVATCPVRDCVWGAWNQWSGCSCTCGGGLKRRNRVVQETPREGGLPCSPYDKSEVLPCNTQPCEECVDGLWTGWSEWSSCTATCSPSYSWRHRSIKRRHNHCGKPVLGLEEDYKLCDDQPICEQDVDCKLSQWSMWSSCSCSCYGITERHRVVATLAVGKGRPCQESDLKEIAPCNPGSGEEQPLGCEGTGPRNCVLSNWDDWGACSVLCGGGQRTRMRQILQPAAHGGLPCRGDLAELGSCNTHHCPGSNCIDCQWGAWSQWGDCSACKGEKYRQRTVDQLQNECGHKCNPGVSKEATSCSGICPAQMYCRWSEWTDLGGCSATCGTAVKLKQRRLQLTERNGTEEEWAKQVYFLAGTEDMVCSGEQTETAACPYISCQDGCTPKDCQFGPWSEWGEPSCTQLCSRDRHIARRSSCGGRPCSGSQSETKYCYRQSCIQPLDCLLGEWDDWTSCNQGTGGQRIRSRIVLAEAQNGGSPCQGSLEETLPCEDWLALSAVVNCVFSDWHLWSECTVLCGGGVKHRHRVMAPPAAGGGQPCEGSMEELGPCNQQSCDGEGQQDCMLSPWSEWGHCDSHDQRERSRTVAQEPSVRGLPCNGTLMEVAACAVAEDCVVSPWTSWDTCDKSCDGGQKQRQRQVISNPRNRGAPCPGNLVETTGCNREPCADVDVNCKISEWRSWSDCSATCGPGFQERTREITARLSHCGQGCLGNTTMVRPCFLEDCGTCEKCVWGEWKEWSECSRHCGGGQRHRKRNITRWPTPGCPPCPAKDKVWIDSCNTEPCPEDELCIDGRWSSWSEWEVCSTSCQGGVTWRTRQVALQATPCGSPPTGESREESQCNIGIPCKASQDCEWGPWSIWSDCSSSCNGVKSRSRQIAIHGYGDGRYCEGSFEETFPCASGISQSLINWQSDHLYMDFKQMTSNNLGGKGPNFKDLKMMRFDNVAADSAQSVDLEITASASYNPGEGAQFNGKLGDFGNIFVPRGESVDVTFWLRDKKTGDEVVAEDIVLKFFDSDEDGSELSTFDITVQGQCEEFYSSSESVYKISGDCKTPGGTTFTKPMLYNAVCENGGFEYLNFGSVKNNNLGGKGPDSGMPTLHFQNALSVNGRNVDMSIEVLRENGNAYDGDVQENGHVGGASAYNQVFPMGVINQLPGGQTRFIAKFIDSTTGEMVRVPKLNLTFFDVDSPAPNLRERVIVRGFKKYFTLDANGLETTGNSIAFKELAMRSGEFSSTRLQVPEPMNPVALTADQADTAVTLFFEDVAEIQFEFEVTWIRDATQVTADSRGQNFFFFGSACSVPLQLESRRLQFFNIPWKDTVNGMLFPSPSPPLYPHVKPQPLVVPQPVPPIPQPPLQQPYFTAESVPVARPLQVDNNYVQHEIVVDAPKGEGVCPSAVRPAVGGFSPRLPITEKERSAIAIRFSDTSKVTLTLKASKGCGHNFLFAAKVCLSGNCDPCGPETTCMFQSWEPWSKCSESCGGGEQQRKRGITRGVPTSHGGGCSGAFRVVRSCNVQSCDKNCVPVDCIWGPWHEWGACSKCGGQKERSRPLLQLPECGGRVCEAGDAEQIQKCPRRCHEGYQCVWSEWSSFSPCSVTCGCGRKKRTRVLQRQLVEPGQLFEQKYDELEELQEKVATFQNQRTNTVMLAFLAGPAALLLAVILFRSWRWTRAH